MVAPLPADPQRGFASDPVGNTVVLGPGYGPGGENIQRPQEDGADTWRDSAKMRPDTARRSTINGFRTTSRGARVAAGPTTTFLMEIDR